VKIFRNYACALCARPIVIREIPKVHRILSKKLNFCAHHTANQIYQRTRELEAGIRELKERRAAQDALLGYSRK